MKGLKGGLIAVLLGCWVPGGCSDDSSPTADLGRDLGHLKDTQAKDLAATDPTNDGPPVQKDLTREMEQAIVDQSRADLSPDASTNYPAPTAYWTMDAVDTLSGAIQDHLGQNHGTLSATASDSAGQVGQAIALDGSKSFIDFQDGLSSTFGGANKTFSISMWIKPAKTLENHILLSKSADSACEPDENQRMWFTSLKAQSKPAFSFQTPQAGNVHIVGGSTAVGAAGTWTHLLFVYDGSVDSSALDRVSLYLNGAAEVETVTSSGSFPFDLQPSTAHLAFGVRLSSTGTACAQSGAQYFQGAVDELAIWSTALSPSAATAIYQRGLAKTRLVP